MQRARGIGGVWLHAAQPREMADWYTNNLGIDSAPAEVVLPESKRVTPSIRFSQADPGYRGGAWSICLTVSDLHAVRGQLRDSGIDVGELDHAADGSYAWLRDPEHNSILLWQPSDRASSSDESAVQVINEPERQETVPGGGPGRRNMWRTVTALVLGLLVLIVAVVVVEPDAETNGPARAQREPGEPSGAPSGEQEPVRVTEGHSLLGISADWELFASGADSVVRVEFERGRVTRTRVPFTTSEQVSLVVDPNRVLLKQGGGTAYAIPDGRPARELSMSEGDVGRIFPGPKPRQFWGVTGPRLQPELSLMASDGSPTGVAVGYPANEFRPLVRDGLGNVLVSGVGGVYLASTDGMRKVADGRLLAVGPTRLLTLRCDEQARCSRIVLNRNTGERRVLHTNCVNCDYPIGVISSDGSMAAVVRPAATYRSTLRVIDLATGRTRRLVQMHGPHNAGAAAWSPDGKWLFVASRGTLLAFDTQTWQKHRLGVALPPVSRVAIRPANQRTG